MKDIVGRILDDVIAKYPELEACREDITDAFHVIRQCYCDNNKVLVCGNGGSAADAEHIVGELMKGFKLPRSIESNKKEELMKLYDNGKYIADSLQGALPAFSLVSMVSLCTAYANDVASDMVYAQQVYGLGEKGDVVIGISTSGNSASVNNALKVAGAFGMHTIGLTGNQSGEILKYCSVAIEVPQKETYLVQELHLPVYHALCAMIEEEFFGSGD